MRLPKSIKVGPFRWSIRLLDLNTAIDRAANGFNYGATLKSQLEIQLAIGQAPGNLRDTLLHEVLHACWHTAGLSSGAADEEEVCARLATLFLSVLRENPQLVAFLTEEDA